MTTALNIIAGIFFFATIVILLIVFTIGLHLLMWFQMRHCKNCGHRLEYRGVVEDSENGHYLFHCPACSKWEEIPKEEFFRDMNKGNDPLAGNLQ